MPPPNTPIKRAVSAVAIAAPTPAQDLAITEIFSLSLPDLVIAGIIDQYGMSIIVYVIPHKIYATEIYTFVCPVVSPSGTANMAYNTTAFRRVPIKSQGLNFPILVLVFSTITPINGSLNASNTLATINNTPVNTPLTPITVLKYINKNPETRAYTQSFPIAPIPYATFSFVFNDTSLLIICTPY